MKLTKFKKTVGSLFVLGLMLLSAPLVAFASTANFPFTDVPENHWARERGYIQFVHANNIMHGTTATTFAPDTNLTRAMAVTILFRSHHGRIANAEDPRTNPFTDVATDIWYAPYVTWANANGIAHGVGGNRFAPNDNLPREQFAVMLHRFAEAKTLNTDVPAAFQLNHFTDYTEISTWAAEAMRWVHEHPAEARSLGEVARQSASETLSMRAAGERFARRLRQIYGEHSF